MKKWLRRFSETFLGRMFRQFYFDIEQKKFDRLAPLTLDEIRAFLSDNLKLRQGDTVFVHANFSILKLAGQPEDLVKLLLDLIGPNGNLLMPFYPLKKSYDFLMEGKPFDLRQNRTASGALAIALANTPGARKSIHPTKSVVAFGKDRDFLISDHHKSPLPYSDKSPYARACELPQSKIIGIGVDDYMASVQVPVDANINYPIQPYRPQPLEGLVIDYQGVEHRVLTYAHDFAVTSHEDVPRFMLETQCPTYREVYFKKRPFFVVEAKSMLKHVDQQADKGETFFYPRSLNGQQPARQQSLRKRA